MTGPSSPVLLFDPAPDRLPDQAHRPAAAAGTLACVVAGDLAQQLHRGAVRHATLRRSATRSSEHGRAMTGGIGGPLDGGPTPTRLLVDQRARPMGSVVGKRCDLRAPDHGRHEPTRRVEPPPQSRAGGTWRRPDAVTLGSGRRRSGGGARRSEHAPGPAICSTCARNGARAASRRAPPSPTARPGRRRRRTPGRRCRSPTARPRHQAGRARRSHPPSIGSTPQGSSEPGGWQKVTRPGVPVG